MHELSIAQSIVEIVEEEAKKQNATSVNKLILEIGTMSGIVVEALEFAMEEVIKNTCLSNAKIDIEEIKAIAVCEMCQTEFETFDLYSPCPKCNHLYSNIIKGKELRIKSIVIFGK
ncbi:MAG TPA: hydrogenase maturation nickel metallochaperone HypA [Bacteroidales bacterium]|nr:MAG: hydrogenase maturation nickel metallochaperone HypA [Bacteroidetes bacterium GWF2_33_38]HBF89002.1 hydrogenase maturation nickel metallochaperone HypA [Bacteroidales bacterium]